MSRTSRIPHPPGSRFVMVNYWAVKRFGLAGAAVIGVLDYWDRAQDSAEQPLGSRNRIVAELEGIVGRNLVDSALRDLAAAGVIRAHKTTVPGQRNLQTWINYGLDLGGLAHLLATAGAPETGSSGDYPNRESLELPKPVPKPGLPSIKKEVDLEAAAPRAFARGSAGAAATATQVGKRRKKRDSGIVTWDAEDIAEAEDVEARLSPDQIRAAVAALIASGKQPVPGLVSLEAERQQQQRATAERSAAAEAARQVRLHAQLSSSDLAAVERGRNLLPETLRAHVKQNSEDKNAQA